MTDLKDPLEIIIAVFAILGIVYGIARWISRKDDLEARVAELEEWKENRNEQLTVILDKRLAGYAKQDVLDVRLNNLERGHQRIETKLDTVITVLTEKVLK